MTKTELRRLLLPAAEDDGWEPIQDDLAKADREKRRKEFSPFKLIDSIKVTGEYMANNKVPEKELDTFMVSRGLSMDRNTVLFANDLNFGQLDKKLIYDYFFFSIEKRKKNWTPWIKKEKSDNVRELVQQAMNCSAERAESYIKILSEDEIKELIDTLPKTI